MKAQPKRLTPVLPVYIALVLLIVFSVIFLAEFARTTQREGGAERVETVTEDAYMDVVTPLLASANPERGAELVETIGCLACHERGVANNLAPSFVGIADTAATRRPPMQPEAYLYEAIVHPTAYHLEGYITQMPGTYGNTLSEQDLGDIIAYLLTRTGEA